MTGERPTAAPLVALIMDGARGKITMQDFVERFRDTHEKLEAKGRVIYASRDEARLVWDVLWAVEFLNDRSFGTDFLTGYTHDIDAVEREVKRVSDRLQVLQLFG